MLIARIQLNWNTIKLTKGKTEVYWKRARFLSSKFECNLKRFWTSKERTHPTFYCKLGGAVLVSDLDRDLSSVLHCDSMDDQTELVIVRHSLEAALVTCVHLLAVDEPVDLLRFGRDSKGTLEFHCGFLFCGLVFEGYYEVCFDFWKYMSISKVISASVSTKSM